MDKGGQSASATDFALLTGVTRERLRTWERRFGFPTPRRVGPGPRRYLLADAPRVIAVRRAVTDGVPLRQAIADVAWPDGTAAFAADELIAGIVAAAPTPTFAVTGPRPLTVVYANLALQTLLGDGAVDFALRSFPWFPGSELERALLSLFATESRSVTATHPGWDGIEPAARSLAYRLPAVRGRPPAVAVVALDPVDDQQLRRDLRDADAELRATQRTVVQQGRYLALAAALAERFQRDAGDAVLTSTADLLVRRLGTVDAGIAIYMAGELAVGTSSRGLLGPRMVTVTAYDDLAIAMHASEPRWLSAAASEAFGAPAGLHSLAVPIAVVGERLGLLLLVFDEPPELDGDRRQLLRIISAGLGFTILRDRLVSSSRG